MIKKITILSLIISIAVFFVYVNDFAFSHSNGSQGAGYSSSPGDNSNGCNSCHGPSPTSKTWLTSNVPTSGYVGGTIYTLTFSPTSSMGYEITSEKSGGTKVGTFSSGAGYTRYNTNRSIVSNSNVSSKTFSWTAPAAGTGAVTFYGCFAPTNAANYKSSLTINENTSVGLDSQYKENIMIGFYPNPASDILYVTAAPEDGVKLSLFNLRGQQLTVPFSADQIVNIINISTFDNGVYLLKAESPKGVIIKRFVKE